MGEPQLAEQTILADAVRKATIDPNWFCDTILKSENDVWQGEVMDAVADLDRIALGLSALYNPDGLNRFTICAFHGPGKTHWVAKLMHWFNFTRRGRIIVTAPKRDQVTQRVWPEFRKIRQQAMPEYRDLMKVDITKINWCSNPDWTAIAEASSNPDNISGHHDDHQLFIVEEASGVHEALFPAIEGALANPGSILVLIGNPIRTTGEFYNSHKKKGTMELYYRKKIQHHETTRLDKKWVESMIAKYGEDSPAVQIRCFGNFCDTERNQLFALEWLHGAMDKTFIADGSIPTFRVSVDVGDGGVDPSVVSTGIHYDSFLHLRKQQLFSFKPSIAAVHLADAAEQIYKGLVKEFPDSTGDLVVDTSGVGTGTAGILLDRGYPVVLYKGGAGSDDPKEWANRRTQSHIVYRNGLRDGRVIIEDDYCAPEDLDDFIAQHASIKTKPGDRIETLVTKEEMMAAGIKSPDMVDAIIMQYSTTTPTLMQDGGESLLATFPTMVDEHAF